MVNERNHKLLVKKLVGVREIGVIIPIILAVILFGSKNQVFYEADNIVNILRTTSFTFITAIGMTYLIIAGGLDLSVGATFAFAGVISGLLMTNGVPVWVSIILASLTGVVFGSVNGYFVQKINLPPFIATMGTMYIARGIVLGLQKGNPVYPLPESFNIIGQGNLFSIGGLQIPYIVIIALGLGVIASFVLKRTTYGRMIFAVGGNAETSRLAGIPVRIIRFSAYILVSVLASFTGILMASRMGSAQPNVGSGYEMQVIAGTVIGGTSLNGGAGSILGALLGSLFMTIISNGMTMIKISPYWQQLVMGFVLVLACSLDQLRINLKK